MSILSFVANDHYVDPAIASLFASSAGPVKRSLECDELVPKPTNKTINTYQSDEHGINRNSNADEGLDEIPTKSSNALLNHHSSRRKRKHEEQEYEDKLEATYLQKLVNEEVEPKSDNSSKRLKHETEASEEDGEDEEIGSSSDAGSFVPPQHETQVVLGPDEELDKAARTVFLGNVSTEAVISKSAKKILLQHLISFASSLPPDLPHKVESIRFRSIAFGSNMPKKAAFARKEVMNETTKSTNAYVVYSTRLAAREAVRRLNSTIVLGRHLRVDQVAHPAKVDHRRCVFVGNLSFVDDEGENHNDSHSKSTKPKASADVEEGLWQHFSSVGTIESVRVIRDQKTRVGKGFAYVQFTDENAVEAALLLEGKKFPPLLPRKLRVTRAKAMKRKQSRPTSSHVPSKLQGAQGRHLKLFGKAGAHLRHRQSDLAETSQKATDRIQPPENFIFEGHRAKSGTDNIAMKRSKSAKTHGKKPKTRSSKRAAAWKASGKRTIKQ